MAANTQLNKEKIDFSRLQATLEASVEKEDRYWRENDAKFRAVAQKVATYEEFEDIVKAAHLAPMTEDVTALALTRSSWSSTARYPLAQRRYLSCVFVFLFMVLLVVLTLFKS